MGIEFYGDRVGGVVGLGVVVGGRIGGDLGIGRVVWGWFFGVIGVFGGWMVS